VGTSHVPSISGEPFKALVLIARVVRRDLFLLLFRCEQMFVLLEKLIFGTDYPGFLYDRVKQMERPTTVNEETDPCALPPFPKGRF
jgi:hypothetical protein